MLISYIAILSACSSSNIKGQSNSNLSDPPKTKIETNTYQKVEINNMGYSLTMTETPKRVVTLNQHATEVMLALGLEKFMVGTAYLDDKILPEYQKQYEQIPVLSKKYPSQEVLISASPDFAYAGWKSAFTEKSLGSREDLEKLGIKTYVQESSNKTAPTLDEVYQDILNIGRIFNVEVKANEIISSIKKQLDEIKNQIGSVTTPVKVFVYDSGEDKAFTAANTYLTNLINLVGGKNVFDDIQKGWTEVSWEEVVNRNPELIVIVDYGDKTAEQKIDLLLKKTELVDVPAIKNKKFVILPLSAAAEGVRAPIALKTLAKGFYPEKVKE
ncbi:ABC transporter substrate-binding protein [Paenibacillus sp. SYP-B3998]|uniref:ABC transporter substrate-binding protein n=1 Tax=Paenibacillus sp. SYP-B3998 TaxID=2678564 RepID=A0A6G3ZWH2_9BACL|nr:ABC transporter substrate-binding protein [Paenibacillus sp. SYP-B3998]NEW05921.1 ABC transporter substrate-binding protein [Paenibacillus sp. SYP-B3998]